MSALKRTFAAALPALALTGLLAQTAEAQQPGAAAPKDSPPWTMGGPPAPNTVYVTSYGDYPPLRAKFDPAKCGDPGLLPGLQQWCRLYNDAVRTGDLTPLIKPAATVEKAMDAAWFARNTMIMEVIDAGSPRVPRGRCLMLESDPVLSGGHEEVPEAAGMRRGSADYKFVFPKTGDLKKMEGDFHATPEAYKSYNETAILAPGPGYRPLPEFKIGCSPSRSDQNNLESGVRYMLNGTAANQLDIWKDVVDSVVKKLAARNTPQNPDRFNASLCRAAQPENTLEALFCRAVIEGRPVLSAPLEPNEARQKALSILEHGGFAQHDQQIVAVSGPHFRRLPEEPISATECVTNLIQPSNITVVQGHDLPDVMNISVLIYQARFPCASLTGPDYYAGADALAADPAMAEKPGAAALIGKKVGSHRGENEAYQASREISGMRFFSAPPPTAFDRIISRRAQIYVEIDDAVMKARGETLDLANK